MSQESGRRLTSWKEIAAYLHCGVRTVQRWEKTEGCPIRRHLHHAQGSIYAFTGELDDWLATRASPHARSSATPATQLPILVGRLEELTRLDASWNRAVVGMRQVVFVDGAVGVGKTALVRAFVDRHESALIVQGQCVEHYGAGEAYLPLIDGLTRLLRDPSNRHLATVMTRCAPTWLKHLPDFPNRESPQGPVPSSRPETMVRELIDALEFLARHQPVVLVLEDLHWSDWSTVELIDRIARRPDEARLLIVGTYRVGEWSRSDHPLMRIHHELAIHGRCHHIRVTPLTVADVTESLRHRGVWTDIEGVAAQLHRWTGGIPLFLNVLIDYLVDSGGLTLDEGSWRLTAPDGPLIAPRVRDIIDDRLRRLDAEARQFIEAASVAGHTFLAAVVAAEVRAPVTEVERVLDALTRRDQFVHQAAAAESFGDVVTTRYEFLHSLYQHVVYEQLPPSTRADLHRAAGRFLESVHRSGRDDLSAEIAVHFERSRDFPQAAAYYDKAAAVALGRSADHEAHTCAVKALQCLAHVAGSPDRDRQELSVRLKVCAALSNVSTMGDPRVERAYREVLTMCERVGDDAQVVPALLGIVRFHHVRGDVAAGHSVAERALKVARAVGDPVLLVQALHHVGVSYCAAGLFREASELTTEAVETSRQLPSDAALVTSGFSPTAAAMIVQSWTYWFLGHADRAVGSAREALALAEDLAHLQTLAFVKSFGAVTLTFCGMLDEAQAWAESSLALAGQCDFLFATAFAEGVLAWIRSRRGHSSGVDELRHAIDMQHRMGMLVWVPMMKAWLAESLLRAGKPQAAVAAVDEGLETARQTGSRFYDAELHGVRAEALAAGGATAGDDTDTRSQCEALLEQSFEIAADQEAKALQLRAAMRLARLSTTDDALNAARRLLAHTYTRFSEGFSTGDMSDARTLLDPQ